MTPLYHPRPERWPFRPRRLRGLIVVLLATSIYFSVFVYQVVCKADSDKQALAFIRERGGRVEYEFHCALGANVAGRIYSSTRGRSTTASFHACGNCGSQFGSTWRTLRSMTR